MKNVFFFFLCFVNITLSGQQAGALSRSAGVSDEAFYASIAVSDSGVQRLVLTIHELDVQLNSDQPVKGSPATKTSNLNLSKSNLFTLKGEIRNVVAALQNVKSCAPDQRPNALITLHHALNDMEQPMKDLHSSVLKCGRSYSAKAAELKASHEAVKSAINNIRA